MIKNLLAAVIGSILEYYDYMLFNIMAPILAKIFFPIDDPTTAFIKTYLIGFLGTIGRPLGGYIFGSIGDNYGRKTALFASTLCMAIATGIIAFLPQYDSIGLWAPIFLFICRFLQSASAGGESSGAAIFLCEHFGREKSGIASALVIFAMCFGTLIAAIASSYVIFSSNPLLYWRYPFIFGFFTIFISLFIRIYTHETKVFLKARHKKETNKISIKNCLHAMILSGALVATYYFFINFLNDYLIITNKVSIHRGITNKIYFMFIFMISILTSGYYADKITAHLITKYAALLLIGLSYPSFQIIGTFDYINTWQIQALLTICAGIFVGPIYSLLHELFPTMQRYKYLSIFYSLGSWIIGSSTTTIATQLWKQSHIFALPSLWITTILSITFFTLFNYKKFDKNLNKINTM